MFQANGSHQGVFEVPTVTSATTNPNDTSTAAAATDTTNTAAATNDTTAVVTTVAQIFTLIDLGCF